MKKYAVVVVVVLCLVVAAPVLAYWAWNAGDACMWYRGATPSCDANGIVLPGVNFDDDSFPVVGTMAVSEEGELHLETTCIDLLVEVDGVIWESGEVTVEPGDTIVFTNMGFMTACSISSVEIGEEPQPTATPQPAAAPGGLLDSFTVTDIFRTASELVNSMMRVVAMITGLLLGFYIIRMLIARIQ